MRPAARETCDMMIRHRVLVERPGGWLETSGSFSSLWSSNSRKYTPLSALAATVCSYCDADDATRARIILMLIELLRRQNRTAAERIDREIEICRLAGIDWGDAG